MLPKNRVPQVQGADGGGLTATRHGAGEQVRGPVRHRLWGTLHSGHHAMNPAPSPVRAGAGLFKALNTKFLTLPRALHPKPHPLRARQFPSRTKRRTSPARLFGLRANPSGASARLGGLRTRYRASRASFASSRASLQALLGFDRALRAREKALGAKLGALRPNRRQSAAGSLASSASNHPIQSWAGARRPATLSCFRMSHPRSRKARRSSCFRRDG